MKMVLMVFLNESCSGPISYSWLTNDTSLWFSLKQQQQQQQKTTATCFGQLGYFETTVGILWLDLLWRYISIPSHGWKSSMSKVCPFSHRFFWNFFLLRGRGLHRDGHDRPIFCEKFPLRKNNKKWLKTEKADFLEFLRKLSHLFCLEMMKNKIMMVLWHS